ncbi:hypothetical protein L596_011385 [Steinernema carpocapsae]|uniref:Uncharacterized protein n=1 Tax=Steinernema carpocapsae TaxID=34508 RepID=A0A4U5NUN8_STECR|nr:hypothetical protein L596_011385 [Steinernema carpocapsae]
MLKQRLWKSGILVNSSHSLRVQSLLTSRTYHPRYKPSTFRASQTPKSVSPVPPELIIRSDSAPSLT